MQLPSRYSIVKSSASGGFGRVVHARDKWLERDIAIKILDPIRALEESEQQRFLQEAKTLARLSHPNIPAIYDVVFEDADDGREPLFQIIFDYISGQTLRAWMDENGVVPIEKAKLWFTQLASALEHAHSLGVVHRDVKPENIIIRQQPSESCCLVDWGIALNPDEAKRLTKSGYVIGTPGYMSPEQLAGETIDGRTDVYNLGLVLYEALAGSAPRINDYHDLSQIDESIPLAVDELITSCLAEKALRAESASEFSRALNAALVTRLSLSSVLTEGTLAGLQIALSEMDAAEFAEHPAGQRALILSKVADLAASGDEKLEMPLNSLLVQLVRVASKTDPDEYEEIVHIALEWGFAHQFRTGEFGKAQLRRALAEQTASYAPGTFRAAAQTIQKFFEAIDLDSWNAARLNGARELFDGLLANRSCSDEFARPLATIRRKVDRAQRALTQG
jgi:serine/threonine protein kinase